MRILPVTALAFCAAALPALADETSGTILAYDRVAQILVLEDRTVWPLELAKAVPEGLVAGDRVRIAYSSAGESGVGAIQSIEKIAQ